MSADPRSDGVPEAPMRQTASGREPAGPGWFVVNAADAAWMGHRGYGAYAPFESGDAPHAHLGYGFHVLMPGEPSTHYHGEVGEEAFVVLRGECKLLVEGQERTMRQWDVFHAPPWTRHGFVGAGDGPCVIWMMGARIEPDHVIYERDPVAVRYGAAAPEETTSPKVSYRDRPPREPVRFDPAWFA